MDATHTYTTTITVTAEHLDALQHVNNIVYLQMIQEVSKAHWLQLSTDQMKRQWIWMVKRHEIDYLRQARLGDVLEITTWPDVLEHNSSKRYVEIKFATSKKMVVKSVTTWILIDAQTGKLSAGDEALKQLLLNNSR